MNRSRCGIVVAASLVVGGAMVSVMSEVRGDADCGGVLAAGGFGNAGFGAGYSMSGFGGWSGRGCGPVINCRPVCGPRWGGWCRPGWGAGWGWNAGCRPVCPPRCPPYAWSGSWCGTPSWNPCGWGGWYGGTTWGFRDSVFVSVPAGGGMTFFSGTLVPYPVYGYPYGWGGGFGWTPWLGAAARPGVGAIGGWNRGGIQPALVEAAVPASRPVIARAPRAAGRQAPIRASTGLTRLRAARLMARGDAQLREAGQDAARLEAALASYQQAATAAQDQPDALIRQAVVLEALGRRVAAETALDQAVAVDGRLADTAAAVHRVAVAGGEPDPIFDGRPQADLPPLAARGVAILREIGAEADAGGKPAPAIAWLADRWSARWGRGVNAVAANQP
jgi:hypothetical protein